MFSTKIPLIRLLAIIIIIIIIIIGRSSSLDLDKIPEDTHPDTVAFLQDFEKTIMSGVNITLVDQVTGLPGVASQVARIERQIFEVRSRVRAEVISELKVTVAEEIMDIKKTIAKAKAAAAAKKAELLAQKELSEDLREQHKALLLQVEKQALLVEGLKAEKDRQAKVARDIELAKIRTEDEIMKHLDNQLFALQSHIDEIDEVGILTCSAGRQMSVVVFWDIGVVVL